MYQKLLGIFIAVLGLVSCQFSETMVLNEDGSGRMSITADMSEMMAVIPTQDSTEQKIDSIFSFKEFFEERKDSIAQLPKAEQEKLKLLENYKMHMVMDSDEGKMIYEIFTDFTSISEANNLMQGLSASGGTQLSSSGTSTSKNSVGSATEQATAVRYSFDKGVFKRDGYITDPEMFQKQLDSIKQVESFMDGARYSVKYTFPRKIKKVSLKDAEISDDGKTVTYQRNFLSYIKDPDILDIEVVLEQK